MKLRNPSSPESGGALLMIIIFVGIVTLVLGSYLALTSSQNQLVVRSRYWNQALPVAEAGIEEALTQIYNNANNYNADGWTGTNSYTKVRHLGNDYYNVTISGTPASGLTLSSTGFVQLVTLVSQGGHYAGDTTYVSRAVQVTAQAAGIPAPVGLVAKSSLSFGGNLGVDSYDTSSLATSSTNLTAVGMYDATKRTAQAFVGCTSSTALALGGNEHIYGTAASGIGALKPTASGSASVGDLSWSKGAQTGHVTNNFAMTISDVVAPFSSGATPSSATVTNKLHGNTYDYVLQGNNYMLASMTSKTIYVSKSSVLYVTGPCSISSIVYAPGTKLDLYVGGSTIPVPMAYFNELTNANGSFTMSEAVAPAQFRVLGLNSCTSLGMNGGEKFVGVIYAPHADLNTSGNAVIYGAVTCNSISCNGTFNFHYDVSLKNSPSTSTLVILSWAEL